MDAISYKLPDFEGPLDLLLFLVQKNKLNIYDIEIHAIVTQYMDTIRQMQDADLEVSSEFLTMAARLVQIKSTMLLPKHEEEAEQLKKELTGELIEYQQCQEMARRLSTLYIGGDVFIRTPEEVEPDFTYRRVHPPETILEAYLMAAGKGKRRIPPQPQAFHGIVAHKIVSVASKIIFILRNFRRKEAIPYDDLFSGAQNKSELVATFLAVLELIKGKRIQVDGEGTGQSVHILRGHHEHTAEEE